MRICDTSHPRLLSKSERARHPALHTYVGMYVSTYISICAHIYCLHNSRHTIYAADGVTLDSAHTQCAHAKNKYTQHLLSAHRTSEAMAHTFRAVSSMERPKSPGSQHRLVLYRGKVLTPTFQTPFQRRSWQRSIIAL